MEFLLDTINLKEIKNYLEVFPVSGITTTPSIIKRHGKVNFIEHFREIKSVIGKRSFHIQTPSIVYSDIIKDAHYIWQNFGSDVCIKIPVTYDGLKAINYLKKEIKNCNITATSIYSKIQALLAIESNADYIAIYTDRSINTGVNPFEIMKLSKKICLNQNKNTKIMASSIKNVNQITESFENGADSVTFGVDIIEKGINNSSVNTALKNFTNDWIKLYSRKNIYEEK